MLQECNKFREHQAHETLIEMMEKQLAQRKRLIRELKLQMDRVHHEQQQQQGESVSQNNDERIIEEGSLNRNVPMDIE